MQYEAIRLCDACQKRLIATFWVMPGAQYPASTGRGMTPIALAPSGECAFAPAHEGGMLALLALRKGVQDDRPDSAL
jgi:hypothetical protein